jgi:hypothetical protein
MKKDFECHPMNNGEKMICTKSDKKDNYFNPAMNCPFIKQNKEKQLKFKQDQNNTLHNYGKLGPIMNFSLGENTGFKMNPDAHRACDFNKNKNIGGKNFWDATGFYN